MSNSTYSAAEMEEDRRNESMFSVDKVLAMQKTIPIIREYARETGNNARSGSDLSPLEEWLLIKLVKLKYNGH